MPTCRGKGVIVAKAGGGSAVAPQDRLDQPALQRTRQERLQTLSRQVAVRGLALGFEAGEIIDALKHELALHGDAAPRASEPTPLEHDEVPLLASRNRLRGRIASVRAGELLAEVTVEVPAGEIVAAVTRVSLERLGLETGARASAYIKATEIALGR
jgi:molybdopterin-binding protein